MDKYLVELLDAGLTPEQMRIVRIVMAQYALEAMMDSEVREEVENICQQCMGV